jgi:hypothetical protein
MITKIPYRWLIRGNSNELGCGPEGSNHVHYTFHGGLMNKQ